MSKGITMCTVYVLIRVYRIKLTRIIKTGSTVYFRFCLTSPVFRFWWSIQWQCRLPTRWIYQTTPWVNHFVNNRHIIKKKIGRKNWFGFDKCVLTCRRIYATFQPEVFRKATYLQLFTYLHQSHWVLWGGFDVVDSLTTRLRKSNIPSWRVISHCSMNPFVILGQN